MPAIDTLRKLSPHNKAAISLAIIAILVHYITLLVYAENIPVGDDYYDVLRFLHQYENAVSIKEKLLAIYMQHNEHRTAFSRIIYLVMYELSGSINFRTLMLIGDLSTIGIIILLANQYKNQKYVLVIWAFIAIFLLNLQSWSSMFWAMTAISNYSVVFFTLACFTCLATNKTAGLFFALLFAACASLSMGNGLLTWPIGMLCIVIGKPNNRKLHTTLWLLATALFASAYLYGYKTSEAMQLQQQFQLSHWLNATRWALAFLGSSWTFESRDLTTATMAGSLLIALACTFSIGLIRTTPVIFCFLAFIILSAAITAYSRFGVFGPEQALSSRYTTYSTYLSCLVFIHLFIWLSTRRAHPPAWGHALIAIALMHTTATYATSFDPMRMEQRDIEDAMRRWLLTGKGSRFEFVLMPDGGAWIEDSIISKRWDSRPLFTDSLYFRNKKHVDICSESPHAGELTAIARRHPDAVAGEILIDDGPLLLDRAQHIVACRDQRAYIAPITNPSRNHKGKLSLHYLKTDPIEHTDKLLIESRAGKLYKAVLLPQ